MCGIAGLISYKSRGVGNFEFKLFENLLYADALRGSHGTGLFAVDYRGSSTWVKVGGPPTQLFGTKPYENAEKFVSSHDVRFLVGHNRYATKGKHTTDNAHPFRDEHIILVHNGTLENYKHLPDYKKYEVDSQLLTHAIAVDGIDKTIEGLEGAWTIVYWDKNQKTLNILRNKERPLWMAYHEKEQLFAFASERLMLEWCLDRNFFWGADIYCVPVDTLFSFGLEEGKPKTKKLEGKYVAKKPIVVPGTDNSKDGAVFESVSSCDIVPCTSANTAGDTSIVPYKQTEVSRAASEWGRGKTGSAGQQGTLLPVPYAGKKKNKNRQQWVSTEALHGFLKGQQQVVEILDYDLVEGTIDSYTFLCHQRDVPDIEFIVHVRGEKSAEALADASGGIQGTVFTIQKSTQPTAVCPHRIILRDPQPVYTQPSVH